jgi:hypothetical protein
VSAAIGALGVPGALASVGIAATFRATCAVSVATAIWAAAVVEAL